MRARLVSLFDARLRPARLLTEILLNAGQSWVPLTSGQAKPDYESLMVAKFTLMLEPTTGIAGVSQAGGGQHRLRHLQGVAAGGPPH